MDPLQCRLPLGPLNLYARLFLTQRFLMWYSGYKHFVRQFFHIVDLWMVVLEHSNTVYSFELALCIFFLKVIKMTVYAHICVNECSTRAFSVNCHLSRFSLGLAHTCWSSFLLCDFQSGSSLTESRPYA